MKEFIFDSLWWLQTRFPDSLSKVTLLIWSWCAMDFLRAFAVGNWSSTNFEIIELLEWKKTEKKKVSKFKIHKNNNYRMDLLLLMNILPLVQVSDSQTNIPFSLSTPSHVKANLMHRSCNEDLAVLQASTISQSMVIIVLSSVKKGQTITHKLYDWKVCHDELSDWFPYGSDR